MAVSAEISSVIDLFCVLDYVLLSFALIVLPLMYCWINNFNISLLELLKPYISKTMEPGDVIMVKDGKSIIAKGIMLFMDIYKKKLGLDIPERYHHAGRIISLWGVLYVAEANAKGFQVQKLFDAYTVQEWKNRVDVYKPVRPYTKKEVEIICKKCIEYSTKQTRYDFANFWFQIKLVLKGAWYGPTGLKAKDRFYCSEAVATVENDVRPGSFEEPASVNPIDIVASNLYYKSDND